MAATRYHNKLKEGYKKREAKRARELGKIQSIVDKRELVAYYFNNFGIMIDPQDIEKLSEN